MSIHRTSVIEEGAKISDEADIGAFCYVGKDVKLGRVTMASHSKVEGKTSIADGTVISSFACIGGAPQIQDLDLSQVGSLLIGRDCVIREYATVHVGSLIGVGETVIGDNCLLMISTHVAHDCRIGNSVIIANNAAMGGHVVIADNAVLGAGCSIHQNVRIGCHAMIGGCSEVRNDIIPYGLAVPKGGTSLEHLNWRRIKSLGFNSVERNVLRHFFDELLRSDESLILTAQSLLERHAGDGIMGEILQFVLSDSKRGILTPKLVRG